MTDRDGQRAASATPVAAPDGMLNKVPQVTMFFWAIKVLCTTVGETASDFLNVNMGFGLKGTAVAAGACLAIVLLLSSGCEGTCRGFIGWRSCSSVSSARC